MGLREVIDIQERRSPGPTGELQTEYRVQFTTEEASGSFSVDIPEEDFSPEFARERAEDRAQEIDAAFSPADGG